MPEEIIQAITWALTQRYNDEFEIQHNVTSNNHHQLVHFVREYFNTHNISYSSFSYDDLIPFITLSE